MVATLVEYLLRSASPLMTKVTRRLGRVAPTIEMQPSMLGPSKDKADEQVLPRNAQLMDRAIGFRPWEVSAMVNDAVLEMHAQEAPFLWASRDRAVQEAHYTLEALARLDDRLQAHLEGLQVDTEAGRRQARMALASIDAGVVFMLGALAFQGDALDRVLDAFNAASALPDGHRPLTSALTWHDNSASRHWCRYLLKSSAPEHRRVAIDASRLQRITTATEACDAIGDMDARARASAARSVGECRLTGAASALRGLLQDPDEQCRFWAAWSLTLLRDPDGLPALTRRCEQPAVAWRAAELSLRALPLKLGRDVVRRLTMTPGAHKLAVGAIGFIGDPQAIPWLLSQMDDPGLARMAGEAFSSITGVDLVREDLSKDEADDDDDASDAPEADRSDGTFEWIPRHHEDSLPWPDVGKLKRWWEQHREDFRPGQRHLCGLPVSVGQALHVLKSGGQRNRAAAAFELALLEPSMALFNVRAHGRQQGRRMAPWNS